jgi:hypothetical protein
MIEDGVDGITIVEVARDRYKVDYHGYLSGLLTINRAGVEQLGSTFLGDLDEVPSWTVSTDGTDLPSWVPDSYIPPSPVKCDNCNTEVKVTDVVTPLLEDGNQYCPQCWR